jgi:rubrerythrin
MDASTQRTVDGLRHAMQAEHEGHHFYRMAASATQDPKGQKVFEQLAAEELEHFQFLQGQLAAVTRTGTFDPQVRLGDPKDLSDPHPIFSPEIRTRIGQAHYEMTALSIAIQLELSAVNFYAAEAKAATVAEVKAFYEKLESWERGHLNALQRQADGLREDYWHEGGFSPF